MAGFFDFFRRRSTSTGASGGQTPAMRDLAFREIKRTWSAEDSDITELENGFDWLPGSHKVHVRILPEEGGDDPSRHRLWVSTDFLQSVPVEGEKALHVGTFAQAICPTFAPVWWTRNDASIGPPNGSANMFFFSSAYVNESTVGWLSGFLARTAMLQPLQAERLADSFSKIFGAEAPAFATGARRQTDNMVFQVDDILRSHDAGMSNWIGSPEFEEFAERFARNDNCFGMADKGGMSLETPFGTDSALVRFETEDAFPALGHGLHVRTMIYSTETREQICANAAFLNHLEGTQWTDFPQLGCWHFHERSNDLRVLAHSCFIPNMFFRDGLVTNYGLWAIARALWAKSILLPDVRNRTMREILEERMGRPAS
jgi:hypothetical protein